MIILTIIFACIPCVNDTTSLVARSLLFTIPTQIKFPSVASGSPIQIGEPDTPATLDEVNNIESGSPILNVLFKVPK